MRDVLGIALHAADMDIYEVRVDFIEMYLSKEDAVTIAMAAEVMAYDCLGMLNEGKGNSSEYFSLLQEVNDYISVVIEKSLLHDEDDLLSFWVEKLSELKIRIRHAEEYLAERSQ